jgi:hypothetical protein
MLARVGRNGIFTPLPNVGIMVLLGELVLRMAAIYGAGTIYLDLEEGTFTVKVNFFDQPSVLG